MGSGLLRFAVLLLLLHDFRPCSSQRADSPAFPLLAASPANRKSCPLSNETETCKCITRVRKEIEAECCCVGDSVRVVPQNMTANLRSLMLYRTGITAIGADAFRKYEFLEELEINSAPLAFFDYASLSNHTGLKKLIIKNCDALTEIEGTLMLPHLKIRKILDRRPSCRNNNKLSTATDEMGQAGSRRNSRRSSAVGLAQENGKSSNGSLAEAAKLTPYQCTLLVQSWPRIKSNNAAFTQAFKMLTFKSPTAREIFQKMSIVEGFKKQSTCDLAAHLKYLTELFDALFADLNQPAKQAETRCYEIGVAHYNMTEKCAGNIWENLGEILTEVITRNDCVRQKREAVKAWIGIISYLVDIMKNGYVSEYRRRHARLSIGHAEMAPPGLCPAQFQQQFSPSEQKPLAAGE